MKKTILSIAIGLLSIFNSTAQEAIVLENREQVTLGEAKMGAFGEITMAELYTYKDTVDYNVLMYKNQKYTQITDYKSITMSDQALEVFRTEVEKLLNKGKVGDSIDLMIGDTYVSVKKYMLKSANFYFDNGVTSYVTLGKKNIASLLDIQL